MKVLIVGGGPSALFLAILLKSRGTAEEITIMEQNPRDATYGFGVALADSAIDKLSEADPETMKGLRDHMHFLTGQVIENCAGEFSIEFSGSHGAITRLDILKVMERRCQQLGLEIQHEIRVENLSDFGEYDLIVGADGANSVVRKSAEAEFGTKMVTRGNHFVWWGCKHPKLESGLRFRRYKGHTLILHYYSYTPDMWTIVGEVEPDSWTGLGMDRMSNAERKAIFEETFSDVLEGNPIVENKSNWLQFTAMTNEHWSVENKVLVGDALYRAHFSIGSGTRLAMEDALGLANALEAHPKDISIALKSYEEAGKEKKAGLMKATVASYTWYESATEKLDLPILDFIVDFMGRTGRMPEERMRIAMPNLFAALDERDQASG